MIVEKSLPGLRRMPAASDHILTHAGFADLDAELQQFAVNPWSTPKRVLAAHRTNQLPDVFRHCGPPRLPTSDFPSPEQTKTLAVPAEDVGCFDDEDPAAPILPDGTEPSPE